MQRGADRAAATVGNFPYGELQSTPAGLPLGAAHKRHRVSLGTVHFTLTAGKAKAVVLRLSRASHNLLVAKRALRVIITITLAGTGHDTTISRRTLTLRAPARHRHRRHH